MALSAEDKDYLKSKGIDIEEVESQLKVFKAGAPIPQLVRTASSEDGIMLFDESEIDNYVTIWDAYIEKKHDVVHFVPASGLASRFFRDLYQFLKADYEEPQTNFEKNFFKHLPSFAFYNELNKCCSEHEDKDIDELIEEGKYKLVIEYMLTEKGLNYCSLPKALFKFHTDKSKRFVAVQKYLPKSLVKYYASFEDTRTPLQESMIEAALISGVKNGEVNMCFTVNKGHRESIQDYIREFQFPIEKKFGVNFTLNLPVQDTKDDTILLDENSQIFRDEEGHPVFQHAGHGALFPIFKDLKGNIVFVKNLDNVAPDSMKKLTVRYKKLLGGILLKTQKKINKYLRMLDKEEVPDDKFIEIINFVENRLNVKKANILSLSREEQVAYLQQKLNRPLRVCGMVTNEEEKGGMPCWVKNPDGTLSLQIVEYYQVNQDPDLLKIFNKSTHFNPVDMVCCLVDYKGKRFNLDEFADPSAIMIVHTTNQGQNIQRLERPGLWNGCMANWNTIFVEVPIKTFNPVKRINDLLRHEHQTT